MSYKTIVAYLDEPGRSESILGVARALAGRHSAHLIGLHVVPNVQVYAAAEAQMQVEVFEIQRREYEEVASGMAEAFATAMAGVGFGHEWRRVEEGSETIGDRVVEHGLVADLVITGQIDPDVESRRRIGTPERVLMHGGRPLLMVPYAGKFEDAGKHVLIAWNATGEAARAVFDALPVLIDAQTVTILSIDPDERDDRQHVASGEALAASLARHGVQATASATSSAGIGVGATILSRLADEDADLLVMGGYGHSRFSEFLFGGATRDILHQMTVPVLLSH